MKLKYTENPEDRYYVFCDGIRIGEDMERDAAFALYDSLDGCQESVTDNY